jgi:hypothetical protein
MLMNVRRQNSRLVFRGRATKLLGIVAIAGVDLLAVGADQEAATLTCGEVLTP